MKQLDFVLVSFSLEGVKMANYYWVQLHSEKITQEVAAEIFIRLSSSCLVRHYNYTEGGHISYNSRGLIDISDILEKYYIDEEELEIEDEFERFYKSLSPEEYERMVEEAKQYLPIVKEKTDALKGFSF